VKYNTKINLIFSLGLAYWSNPWVDFDAQRHKKRRITQGCAFLGSERWLTTFIVQISQTPSI